MFRGGVDWDVETAGHLDRETEMKTQNGPDLDAARAALEEGRPCQDGCGEDAQTLIATADGVDLVCHGCWRARWEKVREDQRRDPGQHRRRFLDQMAGA